MFCAIEIASVKNLDIRNLRYYNSYYEIYNELFDLLTTDCKHTKKRGVMMVNGSTKKQKTIELRNDQLIFRFPEVHEDAELGIEFQRTLRIPDDNREHYLPPGLGRFPLSRVDD